MSKGKDSTMISTKTLECARRNYERKKSKYKKKIGSLESQLCQLQERLRAEEALNSKYFDCLEQQGLLCGICMEDIVQDSNLPCCSNRLCQACEGKVKAKHKQCPFCRSPFTSPHTQQQGQPAAQQHLSGPAAAAGADSPSSRFAAAIRALMGRGSPSSRLPDEADDVDDGGMDLYSDEYESDGLDDEDEDVDYGYHHERDHTVLFAAAAEAAMTATRGPSGTCGLCGSNWLMSSLATSADLPDMLLCRTCWRNIPDLAGKPFAPASQSGNAAASLLFQSAAAGELARVPAAAATTTPAATLPSAGSRRAGGVGAGSSSRSNIVTVGVPGSQVAGMTTAVMPAATTTVATTSVHAGSRKHATTTAVGNAKSSKTGKAVAQGAASDMKKKSNKDKSKKHYRSGSKRLTVVASPTKHRSPRTTATALPAGSKQKKKKKGSHSRAVGV